MVGPHYLDMIVEVDHIYLSLQYSHHDPTSQIKIHIFKVHEVFKSAIMNFMIQPLNGWNNLTRQDLLQTKSFNPSLRLPESLV